MSSIRVYIGQVYSQHRPVGRFRALHRPAQGIVEQALIYAGKEGRLFSIFLGQNLCRAAKGGFWIMTSLKITGDCPSQSGGAKL